MGLLPGGEADSQEPQSLLLGHMLLPPSGFILLLLFGVGGEEEEILKAISSMCTIDTGIDFCRSPLFVWKVPRECHALLGK